jgi:uncharacterized paraquat-inducible protein A
VTVTCPHCQKSFDTSELMRRPGTHGRECPLCKGMVTTTQPYPNQRKAISLIVACLFLMRIGVQNPITLIIAGLLLWFPAYVVFSMFTIFVLPLGLRPLKERPSQKPFDSYPYNLFSTRSK